MKNIKESDKLVEYIEMMIKQSSPKRNTMLKKTPFWLIKDHNPTGTIHISCSKMPLRLKPHYYKVMELFKKEEMVQRDVKPLATGKTADTEDHLPADDR